MNNDKKEMLTRENYFSKEMQKQYCGSSQIKDFLKCPSMAMAKINGEYAEESEALIQGQFMDAHFEGTLDIFQAKHPELYKRDGNLLAKYECIKDCINIVENDETMLKLCTGQQQQIFTGEIEGVPIKIMIDSLLPDRIVDRKCMADFKDKWVNSEYVPWWKAYRYDIQAAIYQEIYRQNTGEKVPFELVAITKEKTLDKAWIRFSDQTLKIALEEVKYHMEEIQMIKSGMIEPEHCGECNWCKSQKKLTTYTEV